MQTGFHIGDKVRFLDETGEGCVKMILSKTTVLVAIEDGLEIPFPVKKLVHCAEEKKTMRPAADKSVADAEQVTTKKNRKQPLPAQKHTHRARLQYLSKEIDLHIENLSGYTAGLTNAEMLLMQLDRFHKFMHEALANHYHSIIIIHGVGNGTLKREIRNHLKLYKGIRVADAPSGKYGSGATEVVFF